MQLDIGFDSVNVPVAVDSNGRPDCTVNASINKGATDPVIYENEIRGDTGLARVHEFAPHNPPGGELQGSVRANEARAFATQLEGDRGQVSGGGRHDDSASAGAACKEDVVKPLPEEALGNLRPALNYGEVLCRKVLAKELGDGRRRA